MNTVILAAGKPDYKNMATGLVSSQLMSIVNGKPIISWVIGDYLKKTSNEVIIVVNKFDEELIQFLKDVYVRNKRVSLCLVEHTKSILDSCLASIELLHEKNADFSKPLRIMLGDTLLKNTKFISGDYVYVSKTDDLSEKWCLVDIDKNGYIESSYNKKPGLDTKHYKVIVGRYEFLNTQDFEKALVNSISKNEKELIDVIINYNQIKNKQIKTIEIFSDNWIDFGHLDGISKAKNKLMESRAFNSIEIMTPIPLLIKKSTNKDKLYKEFLWYKNLPDELKVLGPQLIEYSEKIEYSEIKMEYYGYSTLTEKFVYVSLPASFWQFVIKNLFKLVVEFEKIKPNKISDELQNCALDIYQIKTFQRLEELKKQRLLWKFIVEQDYIKVNGKDLKNVGKLTNFIKKVSQELSDTTVITFVHGDLCFNNILYDSGSGIVKLIDPRGGFGKEASSYGDIRYDIAKLKHSFCGGYDHIIEGHFNLSREKTGDIFLEIPNLDVDKNEKIFKDILNEYHYNAFHIDFIEALLFISMTPLHNDSIKKQIAFYLLGLIKLNSCFEQWEEK